MAVWLALIASGVDLEIPRLPESLDSWAARVKRPGYTLRYRSQTRTHYVALFDVGDDCLAFCRKRIAGTGSDAAVKIEITDVSGNNLEDTGRKRRRLTRPQGLVPTSRAACDGEVIPIARTFNGRMRVVFQVADTVEGPGPAKADRKLRTVVDVHIYWGKRAAPDAESPRDRIGE